MTSPSLQREAEARRQDILQLRRNLHRHERRLRLSAVLAVGVAFSLFTACVALFLKELFA